MHGVRQYRSGGEKGRTHGLRPHESAGGQFEVLRQPAAVHQARIVAAGESDRVAGTVEPFRVERDCVEIRAVQITGGHLGPRTRSRDHRPPLGRVSPSLREGDADAARVDERVVRAGRSG